MKTFYLLLYVWPVSGQNVCQLGKKRKRIKSLFLLPPRRNRKTRRLDFRPNPL